MHRHRTMSRYHAGLLANAVPEDTPSHRYTATHVTEFHGRIWGRGLTMALQRSVPHRRHLSWQSPMLACAATLSQLGRHEAHLQPQRRSLALEQWNPSRPSWKMPTPISERLCLFEIKVLPPSVRLTLGVTESHSKVCQDSRALIQERLK